MVNLQDTPSGGALTAADLAEARRFNAGTVLHLRRATLLPAGCDQQGRYETRSHAPWHDTVDTDFGEQPEPAEASTSVGADTRPAALSMDRHRRTAGRVALALIAVPAVAAVVAVVAFAARHWPG